ncbi:MAG: M61 family metallopeptidase [Myxococcales bacterium]|nr:M61 family metallopeptidase [Myxococcales bacterium]
MAKTTFALLASLTLGGCPHPETDRPQTDREIAGDPDEGSQKTTSTKPLPAGDGPLYILSFADRAGHYLDVEAHFPGSPGGDREIAMATWTPGSYLIREYARHIDQIDAANAAGQPLPIVKTRKNRWRIEGGGQSPVRVRYRIYAHELSVRDNYVDGERAILNGAPTFLAELDKVDRPHRVQVRLPNDWAHAVTPLRRDTGTPPSTTPPKATGAQDDKLNGESGTPDGEDPKNTKDQAPVFVAESYDELVDSPWIVGNPKLYHFEVDGVPHTIANDSEPPFWDGERFAKDVETIVRTQIKFWKEIPYDRYFFLNGITKNGGGGLEHKHATLISSHPYATQKREDYLRLLGLVSHEFFHTWNVKRLRPKTLGPFEYEQENYTKSLWVAEGITSYYDDLLLRRAGLMTEDEYLSKLSEAIASVQKTPGRSVQSLSMASFDTWIKFYRPSDNSSNTTISYYRKGAVVGFLLDARIRELTLGARSLDDVMRAMYDDYSAAEGYDTKDFRAVASRIAGADLGSFFERTVDGTEELDYNPALTFYGLRFKPPGEAPKEPAGWLGVRTSEGGGRTVIDEVVAGSPARGAGLAVGDEILAVDGYRLAEGGLALHLGYYRPGQGVRLLTTHLGRVQEVTVTLGEPPAETWTLEGAPGVSTARTAHRKALLSGPKG